MRTNSALVVFLALGCASAVVAQDPPVHAYGARRSSSTWVALPGGTQVAVDEGVEWQGVKAYLSLTGELVAVDVASGKTLWSRDVGAFWNVITFREVDGAAGKVWAVELRPGAREAAEKPATQYHDLRTGEIVQGPGSPSAPAGTRFEPRKVWSGSTSCAAKRFSALITTEENWRRVREALFGDPAQMKGGTKPAAAPAFDPIDFPSEVVYVISGGDSSNCLGYGVAEAYEEGGLLRVRLQARTYQTMGDAPLERPYGIVVLPRRAGKKIVIERNEQRYIGGPAIWKELRRFDLPGDPAQELDEMTK